MSITSITDKSQYDLIIKEVLEFVRKTDTSYSQPEVKYYDIGVNINWGRTCRHFLSDEIEFHTDALSFYIRNGNKHSFAWARSLGISEDTCEALDKFTKYLGEKYNLVGPTVYDG